MRRSNRWTSLARLAVSAAALALCAPASSARQGAAFVTPVPDYTQRAALLRDMDQGDRIAITLCLDFRDPAKARAYADSVSKPGSPLFRRFLSPSEIADRFGPTARDYATAVASLRAAGLQVTETPGHRMDVQASGTVAQVETAFGTRLRWYREAREDWLRRPGHTAELRTFFSHSEPARIPAGITAKVSGILGLDNYVRPVAAGRGLRRTAAQTAGPFTPAQLRTAYDVAPMYNSGLQGQGRTIGITSFAPFTQSDISSFVTGQNLPTPAGGAGSNVSVTFIGTVTTGTSSFETTGDIECSLAMAPLATVKVYEYLGGDSNGYADLLSKEASDNLVDVVNESWIWWPTASWCVPLNNYHVTMTMEGISYHCASGDWGQNYQSTTYPDSDPEVHSVGGTVLYLDSSNQRANEVAWTGSGGGYDTSGTFAQPSWQTGRGVPTGMPGRLCPDTALLSAGSNVFPDSNWAYYALWNGSDYTGDGTSFASPTTSASTALVEQWLIANGYLTANSSGKYRLGRLQDIIYAQNGRNDVWFDIISGSNMAATGIMYATPFWDYVTGWGCPDFYNFAVSLSAPLAVTVAPQGATISQGATQQMTATVAGSNVQSVTWSVLSGPGTISASGLYTAPATVPSTEQATIQATSTINTASPVTGTASITVLSQGYAVSGTVSMVGCTNPQQQLSFEFRPSSGTAFTLTTTLDSTGAFTLSGIPSGAYTIAIKGPKWLQRDVTGVNVTGTTSGVSATLLPGDDNGDNVVDLNDFSILAAAFGTAEGQAGYNVNADFNCDGVIDLNDFSLLAADFGLAGDP
jgi:subtilase family serine protease